MNLKDKIIIIFYVGVKSLPNNKAAKYMCDIKHYFKNEIEDESSKLIFVPVHSNDDVKVEAINPVQLKDEDYEIVKESVEKFSKAATHWVTHLEEPSNV